MVCRTIPKSSRSKDFPDQAFVRAPVPVHIGLDERISGGQESRIARLEREVIKEEVEEANVAPSAGCVIHIAKSVCAREAPEDIDQHVGSNFANSMLFGQSCQIAVGKGVSGLGDRVWVRS